MHIIYILLYISPLIYTGAAGPPPNGCVVTAHYTGTLESDGSKFDSSRGEYKGFVCVGGFHCNAHMNNI